MRYSYSALVLATFTIGHVLAGPVKHAHQHLHKKNDVLDVEAVEKRDWEDVNFATVIITYSKGQTFGDATAAPAAPAATTPAPAPAPAPAAPTPATPAPVAVAAAAPVKIASAPATGADSKVQAVALSDAAVSRLSTLGAKQGANAVSPNGAIWVGNTGDFTADLINNSAEDLIIVAWGAQGSWVNAVAPHITHSLDAGATLTLSFASGVSGALSAIYADTTLVDGQVSNTWAEFTFGSISVFDVSREVNMSGHSVSLVGDICTSDMNTCVFKCSSGNVCTFGYELDNCAPGSQVGAEYGTFAGAPSGGCRLGSGKHVQATFS